MKTIDYIERLIATNRDEWIAEYRKTHDALKQIESIYGDTCTGKPSDTITKCYQMVGKAQTDAIIATLVTANAWDGRISRAAIEWAANIPEAYDEKAAMRANIYTNRIHMAHLDQLARTIAKMAKDQAALNEKWLSAKPLKEYLRVTRSMDKLTFVDRRWEPYGDQTLYVDENGNYWEEFDSIGD